MIVVCDSMRMGWLGLTELIGRETKPSRAGAPQLQGWGPCTNTKEPEDQSSGWSRGDLGLGESFTSSEATKYATGTYDTNRPMRPTQKKTSTLMHHNARTCGQAAAAPLRESWIVFPHGGLFKHSWSPAYCLLEALDLVKGASTD